MISFIVPAYNEERVLGTTLDALHAAGRALAEPYEIVVADDASTDTTASVARDRGAVVVTEAHRQIAATRNSGARRATGECLIFVDADTIVSEAVVQSAVEALRRGAVGGGSAARFDGDVPLYARLLMPVMVRAFRVAGLAAGCFVFCTRAAFDAVGGFDEHFYGAEEVVFSRALKRHGRFVVLRQAVTTSGRKLRTHSVREVAGGMIRLGLRGPNAIKGREGMELWYGERREDPRGDKVNRIIWLLVTSVDGRVTVPPSALDDAEKRRSRAIILRPARGGPHPHAVSPPSVPFFRLPLSRRSQSGGTVTRPSTEEAEVSSVTPPTN